MLQHNMAVD